MTCNFVSLCILALTLHAPFTTVSSKTSLTLLYEHTSNYITKEFNFNDTTYSEFFDCLCGQTTKKCICNYQENAPYPVLNIKKETAVDIQGLSNYFQCKNSASSRSVNCTRMKREDVTCNQSNLFTKIPPVNTVSCRKDCLGLIWYNPSKESLVYNSSIQPNTSCQSNCYRESSTVLPTPYKKTNVAKIPPSTSPSTLSSMISSKTTALKKTQPHTTQITSTIREENTSGNEDSSSLPLIIGVVVVVLCIAALVIIAVVLWKRRKRRLKRSNQNSSTSRILSSRRSYHDIDDYNTVDIEPNSNVASISTSTKTNPVYDLATVSSGYDTDNPGPNVTSSSNSQNGVMKKDVICDYYGYSTVITGGKKSTEPKEMNFDFENNPEFQSDNSSRDTTYGTNIDLPEYAVVNKQGKGHKNYFNALPKQDDDTNPTPPPLPPNPDLPEYAVVIKSGNKPKNYFNFVKEPDEDANPTPSTVSSKPGVLTTQERKLKPNRSSYDTVDILVNAEGNQPQIRFDPPNEQNLSSNP